MNSENRLSELWEKIENTKELVDNTLKLAERDIKTSKNVFGDKDYDWCFAIAYNAMLQAGRALMFSQGFRSRGESKHIAVIEFAKTKFKKDFAEKVLFMFNKIRKKRHLVVYEQTEIITKEEAENALDIAESFVKKVKELIN